MNSNMWELDGKLLKRIFFQFQYQGIFHNTNKLWFKRNSEM